MSATSPLAASAVRGMAWMSGQAMVTRVTSLVGFLVVARFLGPRDYGLAALAAVFTTLILAFAAAGFAEALVQREHVERADLDTVFLTGLAASIVLTVVFALAAWPLASAFGEPRLRPVLQVLLVPLPLVSLRSVNHAILQRELRFRDIGTVTVRSSLLAVGIAIGLAVAGAGVWALVLQVVVAQSATALGMARRGRYRPGRKWSAESFRRTFPFSRNYLGVSMLGLLNQRADDFLVGSYLGVAALGVYSVAYRILLVLTDVLTTTIGAVVFPLLTRLRGQPALLRESVRSGSRVCATAVIPLFVFCAAAAPQLVHVVFGARWDSSAPVMEILCLFGPIEALLQFSTAVLLALGRADRVLRISLVSTLVQVVAFFVAVRYGLRWVAASYVLRAYLLSPLTFRPVAHALGIPMRRQLADLVPAFAGGALMFFTMLLVRTRLEDHLSAPVLLLPLLAAGALAYLAVLMVAAPRDLHATARLARSLVRERGGTPARPPGSGDQPLPMSPG